MVMAVSDRQNAIKNYAFLEKKISNLQDKLRKKDPSNSLLSLVTVGETGISWTPEFGNKYSHLSVLKGLSEYVESMKEALK